MHRQLLSNMSRGQRILMLSLNKRTKKIASNCIKKSTDNTWRVKQWIDDQWASSANQLVTDLSTNLANVEVATINELPTAHDHNQQVTQFQVDNEHVVHDEDTMSHVLPDPTSDVQAVQAQ